MCSILVALHTKPRAARSVSSEHITHITSHHTPSTEVQTCFSASLLRRRIRFAIGVLGEDADADEVKGKGKVRIRVKEDHKVQADDHRHRQRTMWATHHHSNRHLNHNNPLRNLPHNPVEASSSPSDRILHPTMTAPSPSPSSTTPNRAKSMSTSRASQSRITTRGSCSAPTVGHRTTLPTPQASALSSPKTAPSSWRAQVKHAQ